MVLFGMVLGLGWHVYISTDKSNKQLKTVNAFVNAFKTTRCLARRVKSGFIMFCWF